MPDLTPEQQALLSASSDLVGAFTTLSADHQRMVAADAEFDAIVAKRSQSADAFAAANVDFLSAPQDSALLQRLIDASTSLIADSTQMRSLKTAKDDADQTETVSATSYANVRADFETKVAQFVSANSIQV